MSCAFMYTIGLYAIVDSSLRDSSPPKQVHSSLGKSRFVTRNWSVGYRISCHTSYIGLFEVNRRGTANVFGETDGRCLFKINALNITLLVNIFQNLNRF